MKKLFSILVVMGLIVSLTACGNSKTEPTSEEKILKLGVDHDPSVIDQSLATDGLDFEIIGAFIEGLLQYDAEGKLAPGMAESYEVSDDGLVYTFHLRDAVWSNGTAVTADDFVYSWQRLVDPENASEYNWIMEVADVKNAAEINAGEVDPTELGVKAVDEKTFEVTLNSGAPYFVQLMTFPSFYPINREFAEGLGADFAKSAENVLSNGAFRVKTWEEGYGLVVEKNDDYYAADTVKLDGIEWRVFLDSQTAALEFEAGNVDRVKLTAELVDRYLDDESFMYENGGYLWYVAVNYTETGDPALQNLNFRKALAMSFDKSFIVDKILNDGSRVADYIIPTKLASSPVNGDDFRVSQDMRFLEYNIEAAQAAWAKAKEELGFETYELELLLEDAAAVKSMGEFMQAEWEKNLEGLSISLKILPKKNRLDLMRDNPDREYTIALTRWGPDYADPQTYLDLYIPGGASSTSYPNEEYHNLVYSIQAGGELASDLVARWEAMLEAERVIMDDAGVFPIYESGYAYLSNTSITGLEFHTVGVKHVYTRADKE